MSQHVKVGRGIVSESLNCGAIWLLCTSRVFCNGHISLSWKENKNLQTLKVIPEGQPKCMVCCSDCTLHNTRRRSAHKSLREVPALAVKNTPWRQCGKVAQAMGKHVS